MIVPHHMTFKIKKMYEQAGKETDCIFVFSISDFMRNMFVYMKKHFTNITPSVRIIWRLPSFNRGGRPQAYTRVEPSTFKKLAGQFVKNILM